MCGIHPSMNAAYCKKAAEMNVTRNAVYEKLNGVEPQMSRAVLKETAAELSTLMELASVHGVETIEETVSDFYVVEATRYFKECPTSFEFST